MSTPTPGKHPLLQQGKTPSQPHHGATATPSASTPFSVTQAAFSPRGPRSSPQQVKKSPATMTSATLGRSTGPVNFDSPSAAAALDALDLNSALDLGLQTLGNLGRASEDERARRLDAVIEVLSRSKGLVSEAGLERLAKKLDLEFMWENSMGSDDKKTLIVAGSALELLIEFSSNIVQSVALAFPDSAEIVNKHAQAAGEILFDDLRLREGQSPLTKSLESFAANFERLAMLDKLSISPGLNMYEAVAGIYESLCRLHVWELQKVREDPAAAAKGEVHLENLVLSTKSGKPTMNTRGRVGMTLDYWKQRRLQPPTDPAMAAWVEENEQTWSIHIGCAPAREIGVNPVRISDKWIGTNVEKIPLPDELHTGDPIIDWLEPESTFVPTPDPAKADPMQPDPSLMGPRLPDAVFHATFDPPIHIPSELWNQIQQLGCMLHEGQFKQLTTFDSLVLPYAPGKGPDVAESRTVTCSQKKLFMAPGETTKMSLKSHVNTLCVYKPALSRTLTEMTFSHPQQLITILPYLRQYVFLAMLLEHSYKEFPIPEWLLDLSDKDEKSSTNTNKTNAITTNQNDYQTLTSETPFNPNNNNNNKTKEQKEEPPLNIDTALNMLPAAPQLGVVFPLLGENRSANVTLEIRENGHVHVEAQDVLGEGNMVSPSGRQRRVEDVGALLERLEDLGKWAEFIRTRWAV
ncbi:mediator of RNA polymerase II transcription subunit 1-domain-containing protein [Chaetomidium leptoderma]|uniref:Mediator of RNA polymerase II transcription subunit 1 n=1 Tax=Chaetomidium leptoderma TaxID=669021 RepID=A0AAN6VW85_9PEZI|nr:mediator of RNA polymerase II transcription subunit 1-domain-containing protein [Chaetomidium leptoderma]